MAGIQQIVHLVDEYLEKVMIVALMSVLVSCLTYSAFIRYFVTHPFFTSLTHKAEELAIFAFIWLLYWGACLATKEKAHFRIYAQFSKVPEKLKKWQYLPGDLLWLAFNVFIVWQGWLLTRSAIDNPEFSLSLEIHMAIIYSAIPLTFIVTIVRLVQNYFRDDETAADDPAAIAEGH